MKIVLPDPVSFKRLHPRNRRDRATRSLDGTPGGPGPLEPREAAPGNVSMYDHVQAIKAQAENDLDVPIQWSSD